MNIGVDIMVKIIIYIRPTRSIHNLTQEAYTTWFKKHTQLGSRSIHNLVQEAYTTWFKHLYTIGYHINISLVIVIVDANTQKLNILQINSMLQES